MKFKLHSLKQVNGRLGCIYDVERLPSFKLETPNLLFFTKKGCIPHLTHDVMQMLTNEILPLQFPIGNIFDTYTAIEKVGQGLSTFVGLPEYLTYCCVQDPTACLRKNAHCEGVATIFTNRGKSFISKKTYMDLMEAFVPDMYVTLSDSVISIASRSRRLCTAMNTTTSAFSYCFERHTSSEVLKNKGLIAPISGGYDTELREQCAQFMSTFPVLGFLLDGFFMDGAAALVSPHDAIVNIVSKTLSYLPKERLKIIHGAWDPKLVLKMVKLGVDLFDSTYPFISADNGFALTFNYRVTNLFDDDVELEMETMENVNTREDLVQKLLAGDPSVGAEKSERFEILKNSLYMIDVRDTKYFEDFDPLVSDCECLCCRKYTRAYIHHLLQTKEMLASVLLTIHNLHHYLQFFEHIRISLKNSTEELIFSGTSI